MGVSEHVKLIDPQNYHMWTFIDKATNKVYRVSKFYSNESLLPEWRFFVYPNADTAEGDPLPSWNYTEVSAGKGWASGVTVNFWAQRQPGHFLWSSLYVCTIMELMALYSYALPYEDLADRQSWMVTLLLSIFALKFAAAGAVPNVPYLTMYDKKIVACWVSIFILTTLQHLPVFFAMNGEEIDHLAKFVAVAYFVLSNMIYWTISYRYFSRHPVKCLTNQIYNSPPPPRATEQTGTGDGSNIQ